MTRGLLAHPPHATTSGLMSSAAGRTITITAMGTIANSQKRLAMAMVSEPLSRLGAIVLAMVMVQREREFASC